MYKCVELGRRRCGFILVLSETCIVLLRESRPTAHTHTHTQIHEKKNIVAFMRPTMTRCVT